MTQRTAYFKMFKQNLVVPYAQLDFENFILYVLWLYISIIMT